MDLRSETQFNREYFLCCITIHKKKNEKWPYFKGTLKNIDLSEVPVKLKKINEKIDVEKNYEKIIVGKPVYSGIDYYKSDCGLVIASNKNNIFEIFNIKAE